MATVSGIQITNAIKTNLVEGLSLAFEQGQIEILDDPVLIGELQAYESERLPSGLVRYSEPDGFSRRLCICVDVGVGGWHVCATKTGNCEGILA